VAICKYRAVMSMGRDGNVLPTLLPMEGPQNVYGPPLTYSASASGMSEIIRARTVEVQCSTGYRIRFGSHMGEDPGDPDAAKEFEYPPASAPRVFSCAEGCRFRVIGA
jgi:hypothetical protein